MQKLIDGEWHTPDTLVVQYERLVHKYAYRYAKRDPHFREDLVQVGYLGLLKAFEKFDPETGYSFLTLAVPYVKGFMMRAFDLEKLIYVPVLVIRAAWRIERAGLWELGDAEIAQQLDLTEAGVRNARTYFHSRQHVASMDAAASDDEDSSNYYNLAGVQDDYHSLLIDAYTAGLNEREKQIVSGLMHGLSQREIAEGLGVTKSRVGQLVQSIRRKIKRNQEAME